MLALDDGLTLRSPMTVIATTEELAGVCQRLARHPFVTVDTEFLRETTFWPKLCVLQLASDDEAVVVDALAPGHRSRAVPGLDGRPRRGEGVPRGPSGSRNHLEDGGPAPGAAVRHAGGRHGVRLRRSGLLQRTGAIAVPRLDRQVIALHRLGSPASVAGSDQLRAGRRDPPARRLSGAGQEARELRANQLARRRDADAHVHLDL